MCQILAPVDAAKCNQCNVFYHRVCVGLPTMGNIGPNWRCPECIKNVVRDYKAETPVRSQVELDLSERHSPEELMETSPMNCSALDATINFSPDLAGELRLFKEELRAEFRLMHQEFQQMRSEMAQLQTSLKSSDERMDGLEVRMGALEMKLAQNVPSIDKGPLENTIAELKCQLNERDQELLLNDIEVTGIPEGREESTMHLVKVIALKLGVDIDERDVVHAERVGSTRRNRLDKSSDGSTSAVPAAQRPRGISVRFARRATRDALLRAARVRRGLSTDDLDVKTRPAPAQRVYINERLTKINRQLFYHARQAGNQHNWKYVWTREGRIFARKEDHQKVERIRCEEDICRIFC